MTASVPVSVARSGPTLNLSHALVCAVVVAAVASVPTWSNSYIVSVVVRALIFVMLGQAWNVIAGIGGQLSLGHGVFFGVGAYATALLFNQAGITSWIGLWIAALIAAACAVVIGLATMRSRDVYFALGTVVISLDFEKVARFMVDLTGDDAGLAVNYRGTAPAVMQFRDPPPPSCGSTWSWCLRSTCSPGGCSAAPSACGCRRCGTMSTRQPPAGSKCWGSSFRAW